jgi:hypothetical protein
MDQQRSRFTVFALRIICLTSLCLTACSSTSSNPLTVVPQARYAPPHPIQNATTTSCANPKTECIYVTNPYPPYSITVYPATANGNVAPVQVITGNLTGLNGPWGIAVDKEHNIYAANNLATSTKPLLYSITVYKAGADGNVAPIRTITGKKTQLCSPTGIAVASTGEIYVDNAPGLCGTYAVREFKKGANGNAAPRSIVGPNTALSSPVAVALYEKDLYVVNQGNVAPVALLGFKADAKGNTPPVSDVTGGNAFYYGYADGVAVSSAKSNKGIAYVASHGYFIKQWGCSDYPSLSGGQVLGFPFGATGNVAPTVNIQGSSTGLVTPCSDAVDKDGKIYVTDSAAGGGAVFVFASTANGNVAPIQTIQGQATLLDSPEGIAVL